MESNSCDKERISAGQSDDSLRFGAALMILRVRYQSPRKDFNERSLNVYGWLDHSSMNKKEIDVLMMQKAMRILDIFPSMHANEFELLMTILDDDDLDILSASNTPIVWSDFYGQERTQGFNFNIGLKNSKAL